MTTRKKTVETTYANLIQWAKKVELVSAECSESISDYHNASESDWSYLGADPSLAALVGEYKGLTNQ